MWKMKLYRKIEIEGKDEIEVAGSVHRCRRRDCSGLHPAEVGSPDVPTVYNEDP